jgi:adenine-specific DNA-methyltransferase
VTDQPEHLDLKSEDIVVDKVQKLLDLFPEAGTEGGRVDFDRLKLALGEAVDVGKERYGMNWPGKAECFRTIQLPSLGTLLPCPEESVNFDTTQNLIIEGDNLEVLKLLQKSYLGKVKMIYIDPPYNTGNDFIYPDNYAESLQTYLEYTGQVDAEGKKFNTNTEADGRFHSKWMNMMYPRLYLARNLLRDDGVLLVSIDDGEVSNLRVMCDELFGEDNFVATIVLKNKAGAGAKPRGFIPVHEYILCYFRDRASMLGISLPMTPEQAGLFNKRDENYAVRGPYGTWALATTSMADRPNLRYPILHDGEEIWPEKQWLWSRERVQEAQERDELVFNRKSDGSWSVRFKRYLNDESGVENLSTPTTLWDGPYTHEGTRDIDALFADRVFTFPKPVSLLQKILSLRFDTTDRASEDIILDFFAGSGTTAHAVLELNEQDGGDRRFILVQLPEPTDSEEYPTIAEITKERVRRVIKKLNDGEMGKLAMGSERMDRGFRVFKLEESNFKPWKADMTHDQVELESQLELHIDHILAGRSPQDLLFEVLLKSGFRLDTAIETLDVAGTPVYSVAGGALLICLERTLTLGMIRAIAQLKPERVVCLDEGFAGNDQLKANAVQIFKTQGVTTFRTV